MPPALKADDTAVDKPKNPRMDEGAPASTSEPDLDLLAGSVQWATRADFRNIDSVIAAFQGAWNSAQAATKEQLRSALGYLKEFRSYVQNQHPQERQKIIDGFNKLGENIGAQINDAVARVGKGEADATGRLQGLLDGHLSLLKGGAEAASQKMSDISEGNKAGVKTLNEAEQTRIKSGVTTEKDEMAGRTAAQQARTTAAGGAAVGDIGARGAADVSALQQQQAADVSAMQQLAGQERAAAQAAGTTAQETVRGAGKGAVADLRKTISETRGQIAPGEALGRIGAGGRALQTQIDKRFPGAIKAVSDVEKDAQQRNTDSAKKALGISGKVTANELGRITALAEAHQKSQAEGFDSLTDAQKKMVGEGTTGLMKDVKGRGAAMAALFGKRTGEAMGMLSNAFEGRITDIKKQFGDSLKKRIADLRQSPAARMMNNTAINHQISQMQEASERSQASAISEVTRQQAQAMTNTYSQLSGQELGAKRGDMQALNQLQQQRQGKIEDVNRSLGVAQLTADQRANLAQENLTAAAGGRGQAAAVQAATSLQGIRAREGEQAANRARSMVADREGNITKAGMQTLSMKGGLEKAALGEAGALGRAGVSGEVGLAGRTLGDISAAAGRQQQAEAQAGQTAMGQIGAAQRGALGQVGAGQRGTLGAVAGQLGRTIGEEAATGRAGMGAQAGFGQAGITAGAAAGRQLMSLLDSEQGRNTAAQLGINRDQLAQVASALQQGRMQAGDLAKMGLGQLSDLLKTGAGLQATIGTAGKQTEANMLAQQLAGEGRSAENIAKTIEAMGIKPPSLSELTNLLFKAGLGAAPPMLVADRGAAFPNLPGVGGDVGDGGEPGKPGDKDKPPVVEKPGDKPGDKDKPFNIEQKKWDLLTDEEKMEAARAHHGVGAERPGGYHDSMSKATEEEANVNYATAQVSPTINVTVNNLLSGSQQPTSWAQQMAVDEYQQTGQISQDTQTALEQDPQSATSPPNTSPALPGVTPPPTQTGTTPETPTSTTPSTPWWVPSFPAPGMPFPGLPMPIPGGLPQPPQQGSEDPSISPGVPGPGGGEGQPGPGGPPGGQNPINIGVPPNVGGQPILPVVHPPVEGPPQVINMEGDFPQFDPEVPSGSPIWPPPHIRPNPVPIDPRPAPPIGGPTPVRPDPHFWDPPGFPDPNDISHPNWRPGGGDPRPTPAPGQPQPAPVNPPPAQPDPGGNDPVGRPLPGIGPGGRPLPGGQPQPGQPQPGQPQPGRPSPNPWGPSFPMPVRPTTGMGFPDNPITTDMGVWAGMEQARLAAARSHDRRSAAESRKAENLMELERREQMRADGQDPGVHEKLSRIEHIRAQNEAQRDATKTYSQKVGAYGGTPGSVVLRLSRMSPAEREAYYAKYPAARDLAPRVGMVPR